MVHRIVWLRFDKTTIVSGIYLVVVAASFATKYTRTRPIKMVSRES